MQIILMMIPKNPEIIGIVNSCKAICDSITKVLHA